MNVPVEWLLAIAATVVAGLGWRWVDRIQRSVDELRSSLGQLRESLPVTYASHAAVGEVREDIRRELGQVLNKLERIETTLDHIRSRP